MCLAIPGKVIAIFEDAGLRMGRVDYAGTSNAVCLEYVPDIAVGQYTVVHAGFALSIIDEDEAMQSYAAWQELIEAAGGDEQEGKLAAIEGLQGKGR